MCVQCEQRLAATGILLKHSLHFFVVESGEGSLCDRVMSKFIGLITKKKIATATNMKEISALMKCPYINLLPLSVKISPLKSGTFTIAAISGVRRSDTSAVIIVPNAAPTTTPTAKSTTLPRSKNCLNSLNMVVIVMVDYTKQFLYIYITLYHMEP